MIRFERVLAVAGIAASAACGDNGTAPVSPPLPQNVSSALVSLATPNGNDGAVIITLSGPDLSTIQAADSHYVVYSRLAAGQEARVIVIGDLAAGPLFTVRLDAEHPLSAYSGSIQQVATRGDSILGSTTGYSVTVGAVP